MSHETGNCTEFDFSWKVAITLDCDMLDGETTRQRKARIDDPVHTTHLLAVIISLQMSTHVLYLFEPLHVCLATLSEREDVLKVNDAQLLRVIQENSIYAGMMCDSK